MLPAARVCLTGGLRGTANRFYSDVNLEALEKWTSSSKKVTLHNSLSEERLADLYITLPTRDGSRKVYYPPTPSSGSRLGYGHHLVFFHPHVQESRLRKDGTEDDFSPPYPFTRRLWAGGKMTWFDENPLLVGQKANATFTLNSAKMKGFDDPEKVPMVFVTQKIDINIKGYERPSVVEERSHVYLPEDARVDRPTRHGMLRISPGGYLS